MEIEDGPFERRIPLAPDVDVGGAQARYERGVLSIVFPLARSRARSEKVRIRVVK
jgi:HSP20 family molecular chaperone IbpA